MSIYVGIAVGFLVGGCIVVAERSRNKKEISKLKEKEQKLRDELEKMRRKESDNTKNYAPADIAFKENLNVFSSLLNGVSKHEITNRQEWTESIVSINNDELTELWMTANKRPDLWITYLQTFGLQIDLVDQFEATSYHTELYDAVSGEELQLGQMYKVVSSCWIYTNDDNDKTVVCKGLVSKI